MNPNTGESTPSLTIHNQAIPLRPDEHGGYRIGNSRITLDLLVRGFNNGLSPEMLAYNFDTLVLADVYSVLGYYLRHKMEVDAYLRIREQHADELQRMIEASQPNKDELKARLMARWKERQEKHAAAGH
jgi:uncharacterized protein (DUF433 family)